MHRIVFIALTVLGGAGANKPVHLSPYARGDNIKPCTQPRPQSLSCEVNVDDVGEFANYTETCPAGDVECSVVQPTASWFCKDLLLEGELYRVAKVPSETAGKQEDDYARCMYSTFQKGIMPLHNCRDTKFWTCSDCLTSYRWWVCSAVFHQCATSDPSGGMVRPCRSVCNEVVRRCPSEMGFKCPLESRDYWDYNHNTDVQTCLEFNLPVTTEDCATKGTATHQLYDSDSDLFEPMLDVENVERKCFTISPASRNALPTLVFLTAVLAVNIFFEAL